MRVEVKEERFKPITLTITIESEQELCDLWNRQNLSARIVNDNSDYLKYGAISNFEIWNALEALVNEYELYK